MSSYKIDRMVFGMHTLNVTQAGAGMLPGKNLSHISYELDLAGSDSGIDFWRNRTPNTYWKCGGKWGTSGTVFYWSVDKNGSPKKLLCADGKERYLTLAMTHSYAKYTIGRIIGYNDVMYQEGTNGFATGNHIHLEVCEGHVSSKILKNGVYILQNMLDPRNVFFIHDGYTKVKSSLGLSFKHCSEVTATIEIKESDEMKQVYFHAKNGSCSIRKSTTDKTIVGVIPKGKKAKVVGWCLGMWADGYQHCKVTYGSVTGWVPMDFTVKDGDIAYELTDEA